jgi:hypothetical protein
MPFMVDQQDFQVHAAGVVSGPTVESVERLRRVAEETGAEKDRAAYERARDALAEQEKN